MVVMRLPRKLQNSTIIFTKENMTDPILYLSMILGLTGMYVLISSFEDDDDDGNDAVSYTHLTLPTRLPV